MEDYNFDISKTYSLSRILDEMFYEGTQYDTIVAFLTMHNDEFDEIFKNSACIDRVFQLDFVLNLKKDSQEWILSKLKKVPITIASYLAWQICSSTSSVADSLKYKFRKNFDWIYKSNIRHPYSFSAVFSEYLDRMILADMKHSSFALAAANHINKINTQLSLISFIYCLSYSLFKNRLYQADVFGLLHNTHAWMMLKSLKSIDFRIAYNLIRQILTEDFDLNVKHEALKTLISLNDSLNESYLLQLAFNDCDDLKNEYLSNSSFATLYLSLAALGKNNNVHAAMLMLMQRRHKQLEEWKLIDSKSLYAAIGIEDILESDELESAMRSE